MALYVVDSFFMMIYFDLLLFCLVCCFLVRKKEQAIYEMDIGERREWERIGKIGKDRKKCK